jgi:hypothetical protein
MYEKYSKQSVPSKRYRELLGTALCVFNSNNQFLIENYLRIGTTDTWSILVDKTSGVLSKTIQKNLSSSLNQPMLDLFSKLVDKRNRIIHSYQVTREGEQLLATKDNAGLQFILTEEYLLTFIEENSTFSTMLHAFRGY